MIERGHGVADTASPGGPNWGAPHSALRSSAIRLGSALGEDQSLRAKVGVQCSASGAPPLSSRLGGRRAPGRE
eukprot:15437868-Alexandrium_andersonii.AAC.1